MIVGGRVSDLDRSSPGAALLPADLGEGSFDPLAELFTAQKDRPDEIKEVNLRTLSPLHRALLVIDGTVTKFLEAYTMQPIEISLIDQAELKLDAVHDWLCAPRGETVISRQVLLRGVYDRTLYAFASSLLVPARLPQAVIEELQSNPGGLGRILLGQRMETRREVLWYGREHFVDVPEQVSHMSSCTKYLSRTYRIVRNDEPLMLINEKFPLSSEARLLHH